MRKKRFLAGLLLCPALLQACSNPYALKISDLNLDTAQRSATITLSDAQLYTRSRLINDRQIQINQIRKWIDELPQQQFQPQIAREIELIRSLAIDIAASFNPTAGAQTNREQQVDNKETELQLLQLEQKIDVLKKSVAAGAASPEQSQVEAGKEGGGENEGTSRDPGTEAIPDASGPEIADIRSKLDKLLAEVAALKAGESQPNPATNTARASPEDVLRDRLSYQNELFAALNQVELDDRHDMDGNALYRLQLRATVFPYAQEGKLGVARVTLLPPVMDNERLRSLYRQWLFYVTQRLNSSDAYGASKIDMQVLEQTGMFSIARVSLDGPIEIAFPPADLQAFLDAYPTEHGVLSDVITALGQLKNQPPTALETFVAIETIPAKKIDTNVGEPKDFVGASPKLICTPSSEIGIDQAASYKKAIVLLRFGNTLLTTLRALPASDDINKALSMVLAEYGPAKNSAMSVIENVHTNAKQQIGKKIAEQATALADEQKEYDDHFAKYHIFLPQDGADLIARIKQRSETIDVLKTCLNSYEVDTGVEVPGAFKLIVTGKPFTGSAMPWSGAMFAYSSAPTEYAQRVSSVASASEAFSLVAALSALLPQAGLDIEGGAKLMNQAIGAVHAQERAPLVVGFSEHGNDRDALEAASAYFGAAQQAVPTIENLPKFGWVFGPRVVLDASSQQLRLEQTLINQPVTADISIPGWWPYVDARVETAWVGSLDDGVLDHRTGLSADGDPGVSVSFLRVPMAADAASMDALTTKVIDQSLGRQALRARIAAVIPETLSICRGQEVSIIVRGQNLWRGTRAFINGREVDKPITILPDMQGIVIRFDPSDMPEPLDSNLQASDSNEPQPASTGGDRNARLDIVTQNGHDIKYLTIERQNSNAAFCSSVADSELVRGRLATTFIHQGQKTVRIVDLQNFPSGAHAVKLRLMTEEGAAIKEEADGMPVPSKNMIIFNEVVPGDDYHGDSTAILLTPTLSISRYVSSGYRDYGMDGKLVFYKDKAAAEVKIGAVDGGVFEEIAPTASEIEEQGFTLSLPPYALIAYPGIANLREVSVQFSKDDKKAVLIGNFAQTPEEICSSNQEDPCNIEVSLSGDSLNELKEAGVKMFVGFGKALPAMESLEVTLQ